MLTIEPEIFRGIDLSEHALTLRTKTDHGPLVAEAWKTLTEELDANGHSQRLLEYHQDYSQILLAFWKNKLDFAREQTLKTGRSLKNPFGPDNLTVEEYPLHGAWDGKRLEIGLQNIGEVSRFRISEVGTFGANAYDYNEPPVLVTRMTLKDDSEIGYEIKFDRNTNQPQSPFQIEKFRRGAAFHSRDRLMTTEDERTLRFKINRLSAQ